MFTLLLLISSLFSQATEIRNLSEKTYTRDNTFCQIGSQRTQIQIRSVNSKTELGEKKYGEYVFYYPKVEAELLPINQDNLSNFQLFHGKSSLCSKSLGFKISPDKMAVLFLKENGIDPDKLTIQLFNLKDARPTEVIETEYITNEAKDFEGGFVFQTFTPRRSIELGKIKIADVNYTYQDRNFYYWVSYTKKGFEISLEKTFEESDMKDFFKNSLEFGKAIGWDEKSKSFKNSLLYLAVNHKEKKQCVLFAESAQKITGSETDWICR